MPATAPPSGTSMAAGHALSHVAQFALFNTTTPATSPTSTPTMAPSV
jgi:hypothetical protein